MRARSSVAVILVKVPERKLLGAAPVNRSAAAVREWTVGDLLGPVVLVSRFGV